jgi:hypothetical protein
MNQLVSQSWLSSLETLLQIRYPRTIDPIDAPQAISQVEQPQRNTFEERAIGDAALIDVAQTTKNGPHRVMGPS